MIKKHYNYFKTLESANRFATEKRRKYHRAKVMRFVHHGKTEYAVIWEDKKVKVKR